MVVFMSVVGNTRKFVQKLDSESIELTFDNALDIEVNQPFIAIIPTFNDETTDPFWDFMENPVNNENCIGVAGAGNRNFAQLFCYSAKDFSKDFDVPLIHLFEFQGSQYDVDLIQEELNNVKS